jgi:hypothetical protein
MAVDPSGWANPITTRSRVVLEIASELVAEDQPLRQAKVLLREQGADAGWTLCLFGSSTGEGIEAVVRREADLAMINPAGPLTVAYRGAAPWYDAPQPVRMLAVIPSHDQYVFAVRPETGIASLEQLVAERTKLRISLRWQKDHCLHDMLEHLLGTLGTSRAEMAAWGCELRLDKGLPFADGGRFRDLAEGRVDAMFDEAADYWVPQALAAGMVILPVPEASLRRLEAAGYRRGVLSRAVFPGLKADVATLDFSGWPIFVHAEADDTLVARFCRGLNARRHLIPWQGEGPLPVERMCIDAPDTPLDVPLHPAAERTWRELGYLA